MATPKKPTATGRPKKPKPIPVEMICDLCGGSWKAHGENPTTDDCIRLLKARAFPISPEAAEWTKAYTWPNKIGPTTVALVPSNSPPKR